MSIISPMLDDNQPRSQVIHALQRYISDSNFENGYFPQDFAVQIVNFDSVHQNYQRWRSLLPRVKPHFAVKCQRNTTMLRFIHDLGFGFNCDQQEDVQACLDIGVNSSVINYTCGYKTVFLLKYAAEIGLGTLSVDTDNELYDIKTYYPDASISIRIAAYTVPGDETTKSCYGASVPVAKNLLELALHLKLNVIEVSFHAEADPAHQQTMFQAIKDSREVFDHGRNIGLKLDRFNIGGGFHYATFVEEATGLTIFLDKHIPPWCTVIAEPGRYLVQQSISLANMVIAKRIDPAPSCLRSLYLSHSIFSSFAPVLKGVEIQEPIVVHPTDGKNIRLDFTKKAPFVVRGSTGFPRDMIGNWDFPIGTDVEDWLLFFDMGSYCESPVCRDQERKSLYRVIYLSKDQAISEKVRRVLDEEWIIV